MVYILVLNPMRGAAEDHDPVAVSRDRQALVDWIDEQRHRNPNTGEFEGWSRETKRRVDTFTQTGVEVDYKWHHVFKEGSPIQEFNLPGSPTIVERVGVFMSSHKADPDALPYAPDGFGCGIFEYPDREEAAEVARQDWDKLVSSLHAVPDGATI